VIEILEFSRIMDRNETVLFATKADSPESAGNTSAFNAAFCIPYRLDTDPLSACEIALV
jgi:hypothetical protein